MGRRLTVVSDGVGVSVIDLASGQHINGVVQVRLAQNGPDLAPHAEIRIISFDVCDTARAVLAAMPDGTMGVVTRGEEGAQRPTGKETRGAEGAQRPTGKGTE